ncbi:MAG: hypothetical protein ABI977_32525 [Acidobacteriota bacterium]
MKELLKWLLSIIVMCILIALLTFIYKEAMGIEGHAPGQAPPHPPTQQTTHTIGN